MAPTHRLRCNKREWQKGANSARNIMKAILRLMLQLLRKKSVKVQWELTYWMWQNGHSQYEPQSGTQEWAFHVVLIWVVGGYVNQLETSKSKKLCRLTVGFKRWCIPSKGPSFQSAKQFMHKKGNAWKKSMISGSTYIGVVEQCAWDQGDNWAGSDAEPSTLVSHAKMRIIRNVCSILAIYVRHRNVWRLWSWG